MTYTFRCEECLIVVEREESMMVDHSPGTCPQCAKVLLRVFNSHSIGDEIRSSTYFDPDKKAEVRDHGRIFDMGIGAYVESKSERRNLAKQKGLIPWGNREV